MYECMQAEARVLILGRTSWHYDEGRRAAAARPPQARRCARVSDKVAGRAVPDLSNARPLRRVPVALRSHALRAASRRHYPRVRVALVGDTHSSRAVRPTGACRAPATNAACVGGFEFEATMARPPPCFLTGQGGAYSRSARNRRSPPLPRPGQRRVDGSPFRVGRRESAGLTSRVSTTRPRRLYSTKSK